ncbi:MAG: ROK family transcriptional regulator [Sedimentitalea sp.]
MKGNGARHISGGINQSGVRAYNERLILSLIQRNSALPGSDIARRTGLSAQTVSVILRKLENDGLTQRGDPVKGKVGKPSTPVEIAQNGVLSIGLKIGRRSADLAIMDMRGRIRDQLRQTYAYPMPDTVFGFLQQGLHQLLEALEPEQRARVCGLGVAAPSELWNWHDLVGAPESDFRSWQDIDMQSEIASFTDLPVVMTNDATAACRAEHVFGQGKLFRDYAYLFVGAFVGGGVVLNHAVHEGQQGNAGAFGSLPGTGDHGQLIDAASIHRLEATLVANGLDPAQLWTQPYDWSRVQHLVTPWISDTAEHLARAALAACAVIDFEAVVIDGALPLVVKEDLVTRTRLALSTGDLRGLIVPQIEAGQVGSNARVMGAATGPISAQFLMDHAAGLLETQPL